MSSPAAILDWDCGSQTLMDYAEINFKLITSNQTQGLQIYGINDNCFECAKTLLFETLPNSLPTNQCEFAGGCIGLYSPFPWEISLYLNSNQFIYSSKFSFGEFGVYDMTVASDNSQLKLTTITDPTNSLIPLFVWLGVLVGIGILGFVASFLYDRRKQQLSSNTNTAATSGTNGGENTTALKNRVDSIDTFRGICLLLMIFVNYGGGGYWFFNHAAWNGLTVADILFPWFIWVMGCSMGLTFSSILKQAHGDELKQWIRVLRRSIILFSLGLFLNNGYNVTAPEHNWRIPGVLQYFGISYFVVGSTILIMRPLTANLLHQHTQRKQVQIDSKVSSEQNHGNNTKSNSKGFGSLFESLLPKSGNKNYKKVPDPETQDPEYQAPESSLSTKCYQYGISAATDVLLCYRYEWIIQAAIFVTFLSICLNVAAPGCPSGYNGPGGIGTNGDYPDCTGGIHRYVDVTVFGETRIYQTPTCQSLYNCVAYDPEGLLGSMTACTLTYFGVMSGRILIHFKKHTERLLRWLIGAFVLLLVAGCLCGFSRDDGLIPFNKNLWSASFGLGMAGGGLVCLSVTYVLVDWYRIWSGAPFRYLGLNSILIYMGHELLGSYFPFSYNLNENVTHEALLIENTIGATCWLLIAYYCYNIKFFVKI